MGKVKHEAGEFQLSRKAIEDQFGVKIKFGFPIDGFVDGFFKDLNEQDADGDGKSDVAVYAPFVFAIFGIIWHNMGNIRKFVSNLNPAGIIKWFATHPDFFKVPATGAAHLEVLRPEILKICTIAEQADAKIPPIA